MGAVPKIKISKARRDRRRTHDALPTPALVTCPQCHEYKLPHRVCPSCGSYRGVQVVEVKTKNK
ncbi:MAG: 50S ribosomal protein L32 [Anaerolineaceae bacterium 4572_32.1]|nr:MAG: 50S ribosomal protein L32 [Anaerolineaceae bacterium 4572_32.1]